VSPPRRRKTPARTQQPRRRRAPTRDFWGDADADNLEPAAKIHPVDEPSVLVRSLGPPPLPGHETAALHYFDAVYEKAANLAVALAAASDLLATEPDEDEDEDHDVDAD
jgi:hypothetical protein